MDPEHRRKKDFVPFDVFLRRHLMPSLEMLAEDLRVCPDSLWTESLAGYPYWQQIYHALESLDYWLTVRVSGMNPEAYAPRKFNKDVRGDLGEESPDVATKAELSGYLADLRGRSEAALDSLEAGDEAAVDAFLTQIRHLQYHVGHADAALRTRGVEPGAWAGYGE
jgi:hypothetical protein